MSAAALLTVQMAITAFFPGSDAPTAPSSARPPDPSDPYGAAATGLTDRLDGPAERPGIGRLTIASASILPAAAAHTTTASTATTTAGSAHAMAEPAAAAPAAAESTTEGSTADRTTTAHATTESTTPANAADRRATTGPADAADTAAAWAPAGRFTGTPFAPILVADRQDQGSGGYGRAGGLVKLLSLSSGAKKKVERPHHPLLRSYARLSHRFVVRRLRAAGVKRRSSGKCASRHRPTCTSFAAIRANTVAKLIRLKRRSRCPIVVTGGTETGHAAGQYSHGNGYKVDVARNACLDAYIRKKHRYVGARSDGALLYLSGDPATGDIYALESNHWDITFR